MYICLIFYKDISTIQYGYIKGTKFILKSLDGIFSHVFLKKEFKMLAIYSNELIRKSKERKFMKVIREKSYKKIRIFLNFKF